MADNYLGRKMEEYFARQNGGTAARRPVATLGRLLLKNRSHRGYDSGFMVREDQLRRIIERPNPPCPRWTWPFLLRLLSWKCRRELFFRHV